MNQRDRELLQLAIDCGYAGLKDAGGAPIGAVIAKDGDVLIQTYNQAEKLCDPTAHGEIVAIRKACKKLGQLELKGYTIYCSAEPCPMCLTAIYWTKIDRIVYAVEKDSAVFRIKFHWAITNDLIDFPHICYLLFNIESFITMCYRTK